MVDKNITALKHHNALAIIYVKIFKDDKMRFVGAVIPSSDDVFY